MGEYICVVYRAPSDEWKAKIETAEAELQKERQLRLDKERENSRCVFSSLCNVYGTHIHVSIKSRKFQS